MSIVKSFVLTFGMRRVDDFHMRSRNIFGVFSYSEELNIFEFKEFL